MKNKLSEYAKNSNLMKISISYGEEDFSFNLYSELVVDENKINSEIKNQPSAYAFLGMLHKKLIRIMKDKEREMEKSYASIYTLNKKRIDDQTGRQFANDLAKELTIKSERYNKSVIDFLQAQENCNTIEVCVRSFEQRSSLIQTLSANIRKTN